MMTFAGEVAASVMSVDELLIVSSSNAGCGSMIQASSLGWLQMNDSLLRDEESSFIAFLNAGSLTFIAFRICSVLNIVILVDTCRASNWLEELTESRADVFHRAMSNHLL